MEGKMFAIVFVTTLFVRLWLMTMTTASPVLTNTENATGELSTTGIATEAVRISEPDSDKQPRVNDFNRSCSTVPTTVLDNSTHHNHAVKRAISETGNQTTKLTTVLVNITTIPTVVTVIESTTTTPPNFTNETSSNTSLKNETTIKLDYFDDDDESFLKALKDTVRKVVTYSIGLLLTPFVIGAPHVVQSSSEQIETNQIDTIHY